MELCNRKVQSPAQFGLRRRSSFRFLHISTFFFRRRDISFTLRNIYNIPMPTWSCRLDATTAFGMLLSACGRSRTRSCTGSIRITLPWLGLVLVYSSQASTTLVCLCATSFQFSRQRVSYIVGSCLSSRTRLSGVDVNLPRHQHVSHDPP